MQKDSAVCIKMYPHVLHDVCIQIAHPVASYHDNM